MLRSVDHITGYSLEARDGKIGRCKDFLFDDQLWTIRFMVADTGTWLPGRRVLVSPIFLDQPDWSSHRLPVDLTKDQLEKSPPVESHVPVSRRHEASYFRYHRVPYYWAGASIWGDYSTPAELRDVEPVPGRAREALPEDQRLRSVKEVEGYSIATTDDQLGKVADFIVEDESWMLRYMVVDTRAWLPGRKVLIPPQWVDSVSWFDRAVRVDLTAEQVKSSPEYDPAAAVNREYESLLYDFYGRPKYWQS